jgi:probable HAF family extracellular repeat protein
MRSTLPKAALRLAPLILTASVPTVYAQALYNLTGGGAAGISGDGTVVVGSTAGGLAARWTPAQGFQSLGLLPGTNFSYATGASADGSVVVGTSYNPGGLSRAFRWTASAGMVDIGSLPGAPGAAAASISADGSVVVGTSASATGSAGHAFRWTSSGIQDLGAFVGNISLAADVSADGSVVVGRSYLNSSTSHGFRWTAAQGMQDIGVIPEAVSTDGSVMVGGNGRWTQSAGWQPLSNPIPQHPDIWAQAVNGDGSIVVGSAERFPGPGGDQRAFYWDGARMLDLNAMLPGFGIQTTGWFFTEAKGVSNDGRTVFGIGTFNGSSQSFVVTGIPAPGAIATFALIIASALARRRRPGRW